MRPIYSANTFNNFSGYSNSQNAYAMNNSDSSSDINVGAVSAYSSQNAFAFNWKLPNWSKNNNTPSASNNSDASGYQYNHGISISSSSPADKSGRTFSYNDPPLSAGGDTPWFRFNWKGQVISAIGSGNFGSINLSSEGES
jgi:hypothetical protein